MNRVQVAKALIRIAARQIPKKYKDARVKIVDRPGKIRLWVANWRLTDKLTIVIWLQKEVADASVKHGNTKFIMEALEHKYREATYSLERARELAAKDDIKLETTDDKDYENTWNIIISQYAYSVLGESHERVVTEMYGSNANFIKWSDNELRALGLGELLEMNKGKVKGY